MAAQILKNIAGRVVAATEIPCPGAGTEEFANLPSLLEADSLSASILEFLKSRAAPTVRIFAPVCREAGVCCAVQLQIEGWSTRAGRSLCPSPVRASGVATPVDAHVGGFMCPGFRQFSGATLFGVALMGPLQIWRTCSGKLSRMLDSVHDSDRLHRLCD